MRACAASPVFALSCHMNWTVKTNQSADMDLMIHSSLPNYVLTCVRTGTRVSCLIISVCSKVSRFLREAGPTGQTIHDVHIAACEVALLPVRSMLDLDPRRQPYMFHDYGFRHIIDVLHSLRAAATCHGCERHGWVSVTQEWESWQMISYACRLAID